MFTQVETRLAVEKIHSAFKPIITHDMHQQGMTGSRMFVPPFDDPYDPNVHPILAQGLTSVGNAMASALVAEGKTGIEYLARYDLWAPARQYMVYHGQPRILTEIASVELADPFVNPAGRDVPLGPQDARWNYPVPYKSGEWRLRQIVDYAVTATFAGISHVAKNRATWLENFYKVHADWVNRKAAPYAFVLPAVQRDPVRNLRVARHPPHRGSRDPPGPSAVQRRRPSVRPRIVGHQAGAALRRVCQDDARATAVPGPAAVSGWPTQAAVRRDRTHARSADGRRGRSDRSAVRGEPGDRSDASSRVDGDARANPGGPISSDRSRTGRSSPLRACRRQASRRIAPHGHSRVVVARMRQERGWCPLLRRRRASWRTCPSRRVWWSRRPTSPCRWTRTGSSRRPASASGAAPTTCLAAG